jgi:hypothetical protein
MSDKIKISMMRAEFEKYMNSSIQKCKTLLEDALALQAYLKTSNGQGIKNQKAKLDKLGSMELSYKTFNDQLDKFKNNYFEFAGEINKMIDDIYKIYLTTQKLASIPEGNGNNEKTNAGGTRRRKHHTKRSKRSRRNKY